MPPYNKEDALVEGEQQQNGGKETGSKNEKCEMLGKAVQVPLRENGNRAPQGQPAAAAAHTDPQRKICENGRAAPLQSPRTAANDECDAVPNPQ